MGKRKWQSLTLLVLFAIAAYVVVRDGAAGGSATAHEAGEGDSLSGLSKKEQLARVRAFSGPTLGTDDAPTPAPVRLSGTVRDGHGKILGGATVCAYCADCDTVFGLNAPLCTQTDEQGRYSLAGLEPGDYRISVGAKGYAPRVVNGAEPITVGPDGLDGESPDLDATLEEGGALVAGTVADATGGPVAQATVQAVFKSNDVPDKRDVVHTTTSDENGAFAFSVPTGGVQLLARMEGYSTARAYRQAPAQGVLLVVTPSATISGHVVTASDAQPVANVRVTARGRPGREMAISDAAGEFSIAGLRPGSYTLEAEGNGWRGHYDATVAVGLLDVQQDVVVPVTSAVRVSATVLLNDEPCALGRLRLTPLAGGPPIEGKANFKGLITLTAVPPGTYQPFATCGGHPGVNGEPIEVATSDIDGLSWRVEPGLTLIINTQMPDGQPAAGTGLQLMRPREGIGQVTSATPPGEVIAEARVGTTDAAGTFAFTGLQGGTYLVAADNMVEQLTVELSADTSPKTDLVTVKPVGYIEVTIKDSAGNPNDEVSVTAEPSGTVTHPYAGKSSPQGNGVYLIGPVLAGSYLVQMRDGRNPRAVAGGGETIVRAGETTQLQATYGGYHGQITGRVVSGPDSPLANVYVRVTPDGYDSDMYGLMQEFHTQADARRVLTDAAGQFVIDELEETGRFTLRAEYDDYVGGGYGQVTGVAVGEHVEIVRPLPGELSGTAVDSEGNPVPRFRIQGTNLTTSQPILEVFSDPQGTWRLPHVTPGSVKLTATAPDGARWEATLEVEPGSKQSGVRIELRPPADVEVAANRGLPSGPPEMVTPE